MICKMIPANKTISINRIITLEPIKCAARLKVLPPSLKNIMELIVQCTIKKVIRNNPVMAITNLRPMEEIRNVLNQLMHLFLSQLQM